MSFSRAVFGWCHRVAVRRNGFTVFSVVTERTWQSLGRGGQFWWALADPVDSGGPPSMAGLRRSTAARVETNGRQRENRKINADFRKEIGGDRPDPEKNAKDALCRDGQGELSPRADHQNRLWEFTFRFPGQRRP